MDDGAPDPADDPGLTLSAGGGHSQTFTNDGTTASITDSLIGRVTVDYPDSWQPDSWTGDSEVAVEGEVSRTRSTTIGDGTASSSTEYNGEVSARLPTDVRPQETLDADPPPPPK